MLPMPGQNPGHSVGHAHAVTGPQMPGPGVYSQEVEPALHSSQPPRADTVAITMTAKIGRIPPPRAPEGDEGRSIALDGRGIYRTAFGELRREFCVSLKLPVNSQLLPL